MLPLLSNTILVIVISVLINMPVFANRENTELSRLLLELKSLERIIFIAEQSADKNNRFTFDCKQLRSDLFNIQQGIEDHVNAIQRDPRFLPDIEAKY
jgi:RAQPRD family integrative conjugative element protein